MKTLVIPILTISFFLIPILSNAQENQKDLRFKLYMNSSYEQNEKNEPSELSSVRATNKITDKYFDFGYLSFGLELVKEKYSHELELMPLNFDKEEHDEKIINDDNDEVIAWISEIETRNYESFVRYRLNYKFLPNKKINPVVGLSVKMYFDSEKNILFNNKDYFEQEYNFGSAIELGVGLNYALNDRFDLQCYLPYNIVDTHINTIHTKYPSFTRQFGTKSSVLHIQELQKKVELKLGVSYRFS